MHYGIANDDDIVNRGARFTRRRKELLNQPANLLTDQFLKPVLAMLQHGEVNPAHHIGTVPRLRVESSLHCQYRAGLQVEELGNEGGRAQIYRDAQSFSWPEGELTFIGQNGRIPLPEFDLKITFNGTLASQPPPLGDFRGGKNVVLRRIEVGFAVQDANPAAAAAPLASARKFDALLKKNVPQRRPALRC